MDHIDQSPQRILRVEELDISIGRKKLQKEIVRKISFDLYPGQTLGLVGESGSGKSITALALMGLLPKDATVSGKATLWTEDKGETDLLKLDEKGWRRFRGSSLAMVFQEPGASLNPVITCGYQIYEAVRLHGILNKKEAWERVYHLLEEVEIPNVKVLAERYPHQLSGGQQQRVMIAIALAGNPKILLADEPTTALDVSVQAAVLNLFKRLASQREMAILFISHDLGVVAHMAQKICVMKEGEIVESGEASIVLRSPSHPYTQKLLASRPPLHKRVYRLPTQNEDTILGSSSNVDDEAITSAYQEKLEKIYKQAPLIEVQNLNVHYGKGEKATHALKDINLNLYPGEVLGIVGESGSGKSTLGRAILRLVQKSGGQVIYLGKDLHTISSSEMRKLRKELQLIFQDPYSSLNPRIRVGKAIQEPMEVHKLLADKRERRERVVSLLKQVGLLPEHFDRYPHQFSGGQRQRICIARALSLQPSLLVCDESVSALDVSVQAQILNLFKDLQETLGLTYLFITHDFAVVRFIAHRVAVLRHGELLEVGLTEELFKNPKSDYTRMLIEAVPEI